MDAGQVWGAHDHFLKNLRDSTRTQVWTNNGIKDLPVQLGIYTWHARFGAQLP
jgi:hypothetical protein